MNPEAPRRTIEVSFEFSPPRTPEMEETLWASIRRLEPLTPHFVSVTYGAGGSTRHRTHETVRRVHDETSLTAAAHLTCVGASRDEIDAIAEEYWDIGIRHLVALRGDPPAGTDDFVPHPDGYQWASELVAGLKQRHDWEISVAVYPEGHTETLSIAADIENLKRKVDAGATRALTQFFFDNQHFLRYRERACSAGITIPIVPGIMPITNLTQTARFAEKAGASVPQFAWDAFAGLENEPGIRQFVAVDLASHQVKGLVNEGVKEFHFYTLNRADLTYAICHILGLRPTAAPIAPAAGGAL